MRLILGSHPKIHALDESLSYPSVEQDRYKVPRRTKYVALKMPVWTDYLVDSKEYRRFHKDSDYILFMMRDVRAVIGSMKGLKTNNRRFFDGVLQTMENGWLNDVHRRFKDACLDEYQTIKTLPHSGVRRAALFWRYKTEKYFEMKELGWRVLPVRYETLVQDPAKQTKRICKFIGLEWHEDMLRHHKLKHGEVTLEGLTIGNTESRRSIDAESVCAWEQMLSKEEQQAILHTAGKLNARIEACFT